jgi:hypothetical protein
VYLHKKLGAVTFVPSYNELVHHMWHCVRSVNDFFYNLQMSVASLASLRQRLSESKRILDIRGKSGASGGIWSAAAHSGDPTANADGSTSPNAVSPESLACKVGDTQLSVQISRDDAQVLAGKALSRIETRVGKQKYSPST